MIHKSTSLTAQLRAMKIGETFKVNARSGIDTEVIKSTAKRLRKEGYDYTIITAGLPKGACLVSRIEPRERVERPKERKENRVDHHIHATGAGRRSRRVSFVSQENRERGPQNPKRKEESTDPDLRLMLP